MRQALAGEDLTVFGDGTQSRCFTHVDDTTDALLRLIDCDEAIGGVFNVGAPHEVQIMDLARDGPEADRLRLPDPRGPLRAGLPERLRGAGPAGAGLLPLNRLTGWSAEHTVDDAIQDVIADQRETLSIAA